MLSFEPVDDVKLSYQPGDVFNLRPRNSKEDIEEIFDIFRTHHLDIEPHYKLLVKECHEGEYNNIFNTYFGIFNTILLNC